MSKYKWIAVLLTMFMIVAVFPFFFDTFSFLNSSASDWGQAVGQAFVLNALPALLLVFILAISLVWLTAVALENREKRGDPLINKRDIVKVIIIAIPVTLIYLASRGII